MADVTEVLDKVESRISWGSIFAGAIVSVGFAAGINVSVGGASIAVGVAEACPKIAANGPRLSNPKKAKAMIPIATMPISPSPPITIGHQRKPEGSGRAA